MAIISVPNPTNDNLVFPRRLGAAIAITPNDADVFAKPVEVYVGGTGNVSIRPASGGAAVTFNGVPAGTTIPCRAIGVNATGTTATGLVGVY